MNGNEYLQKILDDQTLKEDGPELKALREERDSVEALLRKEFENSNPIIRYGGSKAKRTMIKESYDLDIPCYFKCEDDDAGSTLEEIFNNTRKALEKQYIVTPKTSALRLLSSSDQARGTYVHVDVVPGRFTDDKKEDCYLYVSNGDKCRLKTNLDVQIEHIRDSGWREAVRLCKLWKVRNGIQLKTLGLELAVIEILNSGKPGAALDAQLVAFWEMWRDDPDSVKIEDPSNPHGNNLDGLLSSDVRRTLSFSSADSLRRLDESGWESIFGAAPEASDEKQSARRIEVLTRATTATSASAVKPWLDLR